MRPLPPAPPPELLFKWLVAAIREGGAFVSSKLIRAEVPPLNVPGLVAQEGLESLEQIIRVPFALQISHQLARERNPGLMEAVARCGSEVRIECPEVVAFVAALLAELEGRGWCRVGADTDELVGSASWLDLFLGLQLGCDFGWMPHVTLIGDEERRSLFQPSPEVHNADWNHDAFRDAHEAIVGAAPELCESIDVSRFVQAYLVLLTRTFSCQSAHRFVPVADMMNHSCSPNATWNFDEHGDFIVKTVRPIQPGEEVLISYGRDKSNVRLFRTYGFTLPPQEEPCSSFRVWPSQAYPIYTEFLPEKARRRTLDLETSRIDSTTREALVACASYDCDPAAFLRALCRHFRKRYEQDPLLAPWLKRLAKRREDMPWSAEWWETSCDVEDKEPWLRRCAVRVKMSEYLCLTAHLEALDIESGAVLPLHCITAAVDLEALLSKALQAARAPPK